MVARKWDRATTDAAAPGPEILSKHDKFTLAEIAEFREAASRTLIEYVATLPEKAGWWRGFWQGFAASWGYAVSIALAAFVIKLMGSDIITLLRETLINHHT